MNSITKALTLASVLALGTASSSALAHYMYHDHGCGDRDGENYPMGSMVPMTRMQSMMQQDRALMEQMVKEPDQQKRQELMQQHMQDMNGGMMGSYMNPGRGEGFSAEQMEQQMQMMNRRLDRMQQMMEQMQQHQAQ